MDIRKVAARAKVSTATVSRTINRSSMVSESTAERVWAAIRELNYHPNSHARTLSSGRSKILGLIISDITNPFFPDLVKSFESIAAEQQYEVIVTNTEYDPVRTRDSVHRLLQRKVDGIAVMTSEMSPELLEEVKRAGVPLVTLDTGTVGPKLSNIVVDYGGGIRHALQYLIELGHTRIGFIRGPQRLQSARVRFRAYLQIVEECALDITSSLIADGEHSIDGGMMAMLNLLPERPTAVLSSNDLSAIGALQALHTRELRVPQDVSIIGFDDISFAQFTNPPLTPVRILRKEIARCAFQALSQSQSGEWGVEHRVMTELAIRHSAAPPATKKARHVGGP
ncbi:MAG: LacI family DNA-binding transcriptional regulator [Acidobacteriaceae bacterium]